MQGVFLPELRMEFVVGLLLALNGLLKPGDLLLDCDRYCFIDFSFLSFEALLSVFKSLTAKGFSPEAKNLVFCERRPAFAMFLVEPERVSPYVVYFCNKLTLSCFWVSMVLIKEII